MCKRCESTKKIFDRWTSIHARLWREQRDALRRSKLEGAVCEDFIKMSEEYDRWSYIISMNLLPPGKTNRDGSPMILTPALVQYWLEVDERNEERLKLTGPDEIDKMQARIKYLEGVVFALEKAKRQ